MSNGAFIGFGGELGNNEFDQIIWNVGKKHAVDPALIKAVTWAESNFNPRAYRYEAKIQDASYGLMQTLFATARDMGYTGTAEGLFIPETSIEFGTRYLKKQILRYNGDTSYAVAAYNSGTAYVKDGKFVNQTYVDRVMNQYARYRDVREAEKDAGVTLRTQAPQMGPIPSSPPVRIQTYSNGEEMAASFETFLSSEYAPYIMAAGAALMLAVLSSKK